MFIYNVNNWYWIVGASTSQVFSSATLTYVPTSNLSYSAWLLGGNAPSRIANAEELFEVLVNQWTPAYLATGIVLTSTGNPALNGVYPLDAQSQAQITGIATSIAAGRGLPGGGSTFLYQDHPFSSADWLNFATACEGWVYDTFQALGEMVIAGSGSLPSTAVSIA